MIIRLNAIFLMSVLLLGVIGYPSAQITSENNLNVNDDILISFSNLAFADEDEDERDDDKDDDKEDDEREDEKEHRDEREDEDEHEDERDGDKHQEDESDDEYEDKRDDKDSEKEEFEIKGIVEFIDLIAGSFTLDGGQTIFVDEDTEFDHFDSLADLQDFAVEVEVITSNNSLIAKEIEKDHEDQKEDEHDDHEDKDNEKSDEEIEIEIEIESGVAKVKVEYNNQETKFVENFEDEESLAETILDKVPDLPLDVSQIKSIWDLEFEDQDQKSSKSTHEHKDESIQTALDLIQKLQQKIEKLENRIQTLLEKYESGEYFGTVPEVDSEIKSYTISFEGSATSMDDDSVVNMQGQIHIENLITIDDNVSKFRVNGGDISIDDTLYDIAFGKARVSSTGSSGEKDTIVLLGQVIDFANPDDDSTTIKLVIDSETPLEGDFGLEPIDIEVLPQSKIAGQWYLSGSGELSFLES